MREADTLVKDIYIRGVLLKLEKSPFVDADSYMVYLRLVSLLLNGDTTRVYFFDGGCKILGYVTLDKKSALNSAHFAALIEEEALLRKAEHAVVFRNISLGSFKFEFDRGNEIFRLLNKVKLRDYVYGYDGEIYSMMRGFEQL